MAKYIKKIWFLGLFLMLFFFNWSYAWMYTSMQEEKRMNDEIIGIVQEQNRSTTDKKQATDWEKKDDKKELLAINDGINMSTDCVLNGTCQFSIYDAAKIKKNRAPGERTSVVVYLGDIVLGATMFIGTVVTLALIVSGVMYVFSTVDSSMKNKAKSWIKYSLIGMVVVALSLVIVRVIQYLAAGGR